MRKNSDNQTLIQREKAIHRYIQALDQGDMDSLASVLEAAMDDPELDRLIAEINLAYQEEEQLSSLAADAQLVRDLLRKHLPSAFSTEQVDEEPLTIGDVIARLQADRRVPQSDRQASQALSGSSVPLPTWLSAQTIKRLATELGVTASERFWRVFRDTAIMLGMGRSHTQARMAAAREEQTRYSAREKRRRTSHSTGTNTEENE